MNKTPGVLVRVDILGNGIACAKTWRQKGPGLFRDW